MEYFQRRNFHGQKLSRFGRNAKFYTSSRNFCGHEFSRLVSFENFRKYASRVTSFQDLEIQKNKRKCYVTVLFCVVFVSHLTKLVITLFPALGTKVFGNIIINVRHI